MTVKKLLPVRDHNPEHIKLQTLGNSHSSSLKSISLTLTHAKPKLSNLFHQWLIKNLLKHPTQLLLDLNILYSNQGNSTQLKNSKIE